MHFSMDKVIQYKRFITYLQAFNSLASANLSETNLEIFMYIQINIIVSVFSWRQFGSSLARFFRHRDKNTNKVYENNMFLVMIYSVAMDISTKLAARRPSFKKLLAILMIDCGSEITTFVK